MTQNRSHHSWRKLFRSHVTTPTVGLEPFLAFDALRSFIVDWRVSRGSRSRSNGSDRGGGLLSLATPRRGQNRHPDFQCQHQQKSFVLPHYLPSARPIGATSRYVIPTVQTLTFPSELNCRP